MVIQLSIRTRDEQDDTSKIPPPKVLPSLSPPVTPTTGDISPSDSFTTTDPIYSGFLSPSTATKSHPDPQTISTPREFSEDLEYHYDPKGRKMEFGRGVWSVVYMASSRTRPTISLITPPSSPAPGGRVVAVKTPVRRDAHPVLDAEALALTRLSMMPGSEHHIVPFHGYIPASHSIVMSAVPLSLSSHIEETAGFARKNISTKTMLEPVQGMAQWQDLALKLIAGLHWLHSVPKLVHGDIKPHNILLQPSSTSSDSPELPYDALFADFSSAYPITRPSPTEKPTGTSLTALTPPFAAPELLSISSLTSPDVAPTPASDVFSLAVTLLAAATGDLLLYPGASNMQRLAMAREGHQVIEFARSGPNGSRIPRKGIVEQIIKPAITKDPAQRIIPSDWLELIESKR